MKVRLLTCEAVRPDKRAIAKAFEEYAVLSAAEAGEQASFLIEGSEIELDINPAQQSSAFRAFRKHQIDYEIAED